METDDFEAALAALAEGYSEGIYDGRRYGVSFRRTDDGRRSSLFARELAGTEIVSFNLYRLGSGIAFLKPCEMSAESVRNFVLGFRLSASNAAVNRSESWSPGQRSSYRHLADEAADRDRRELLAVVESQREMVKSAGKAVDDEKTAINAAANPSTSCSENG